eukprot:scaffold7378_cov410-Prasinococcus_capsulatus_cf.AAC.14
MTTRLHEPPQLCTVPLGWGPRERTTSCSSGTLHTSLNRALLARRTRWGYRGDARGGGIGFSSCVTTEIVSKVS